MQHAHLRKLIVNWFRRSQGESVNEFNSFDRFVSLWISFNAWGKYESRIESDRDMIQWAKFDGDLTNRFAELFRKDSEFSKDVNALKSLCPIQRHRPYRGTREVNITNINNFSEVLEAIYVIRCNFFHGSKAIDDKRDQTLVELAFKILSKLFSEKVKELSSSDW